MKLWHGKLLLQYDQLNNGILRVSLAKRNFLKSLQPIRNRATNALSARAFRIFLQKGAFFSFGFTIAQRERAQEDFNVPYEGAPLHPPPICIRKTATAPGSPYSFRIVRRFFYVPQNYQHSRNCETGPPAYRPYPRRLESLTICR